MIVRTAVAAALLAAALTAPVAAQTTTAPATADPYRDQRALPDPADPASRDALLKARGEAYHRANDAQQTEEELRTTRALNDEIAAQNALADKTDAANRLDYDAALARHQIEVSQAEEQARAAAETARLAQEKYDRDYAAWQEQVRLCRTGFRPACTARPAWVESAQ
ncbi:hypothetical protein [uncultured Brevundimonas sp.]|uniref:hypothetical protein n=2 Tax=uncultured Brevundimonas sp. TaxID=213418 RepID=UPI0025D85AC2|nr:hypothetical protein [uncultured Brevundimonas sp.]